MTTTALQHIQMLPGRWARNGLLFSTATLLIPPMLSKEVNFGSIGSILAFVLPLTLIGYCWGAVIRHRFLALTDMIEATTLMKGLSVRCAAEGVVIFLVGMLGLALAHFMQFGFGILSAAALALPLGAFVGWFIGATLRETLRYRLARTGQVPR